MLFSGQKGRNWFDIFDRRGKKRESVVVDEWRIKESLIVNVCGKLNKGKKGKQNLLIEPFRGCDAESDCNFSSFFC